MLDLCGQLLCNASTPVTCGYSSITYFHWKIHALAGIWTRDLSSTNPICCQQSYPGLENFHLGTQFVLLSFWSDFSGFCFNVKLGSEYQMSPILELMNGSVLQLGLKTDMILVIFKHHLSAQLVFECLSSSLSLLRSVLAAGRLTCA